MTIYGPPYRMLLALTVSDRSGKMPPSLSMQEAGYRVARLQGYDMFPQTMHIETLVELARGA